MTLNEILVRMQFRMIFKVHDYSSYKKTPTTYLIRSTDNTYLPVPSSNLDLIETIKRQSSRQIMTVIPQL